MAKKKVMLFGDEARRQVLAGVKYLAGPVKLTLGPRGRNFASGTRGGAIVISNDGVSLAKEIQGRNEFEDIGVRAVREAATKTNDRAGDGTTTAVVLTEAILDVLKVDTNLAGVDPIGMLEQVSKESAEVVERLEKMAVPVITRTDLIDVARVSVQNNELAELVGGAQWKVGASGTVLAEENNGPKDTIEYIYGVRIDNGLGTTKIANNQEKQALELKDVRIIVSTKIFNKAQDIIDLKPLLEAISNQNGRSEVVLMGRAFDVTALNMCASQIAAYLKNESAIALYPINAPFENQQEVMEDLAAATGSKFYEDNIPPSITTKDIGSATKVFCTRYEGIITGPGKDENEGIDHRVNERVQKIKKALKGDISPFEKRQLEARLSQLTAGTAVIKVGAETEQERKYKKDKVDDAVNTVKSALQEGVVPGGGMALKIIADEMPKAKISEALKAPYFQIQKNAGGSLEIEPWVRDSLKVVRTAFQTASSIARSLATTEVVVNYEEEKPCHCKGGVVNMAPSDED